MHSAAPDPDLAFLERILRFQEGSLSETALPDFEHEISTNPHKRRLFIEAQQRSLAIRNQFLAEEHQPIPTHRTFWIWRSLFSSPIWAIAAGLVIGFFSATLISKETVNSQSKPLLSAKLAMLDHGAPPPIGVPHAPGIWSGDYTEVVSARDGITPYSGSRMLQIQRADHEGKIHPEGSRIGNVWYLVDLRSFRSQSATQSLELHASFRFNSTANSAPETHDCSITIQAVTSDFVLSGLLQNGAALLNQNLAASSRRSLKIDSDPLTWEKLSTELRLPPNAEFALVSFNLAASKPTDPKEIIHFEGKYMDELQITLVRR
ncbi:MAG: hypothetical protein DVB28_000111 [Verrucomicrobia bacterium]|nr:MAG: hypothetical protein DVB28_000111 [Verrucomicrobiota bacterium]